MYMSWLSTIDCMSFLGNECLTKAKAKAKAKADFILYS